MDIVRTKKLFIFDLDGTLADAYLAIQKSMNYTLKRLGYPEVSLSRVKKRVGKGDEKFITSFFPEKDQKKAIKIYRAQHKKSPERQNCTLLLPSARFQQSPASKFFIERHAKTAILA